LERLGTARIQKFRVCLQAAGKLARAICMIPKKPGPDLIRAGYRFSEKIMLED